LEARRARKEEKLEAKVLNYEFDLQDPSYTPVYLIEKLKEHLEIASDYQLSNAMVVDESVISRIRNRKIVISAGFLVRASDLLDCKMSDVRRLAGFPADFMPWKFRLKGKKK
jgi:hypothetical protein